MFIFYLLSVDFVFLLLVRHYYYLRRILHGAETCFPTEFDSCFRPARLVERDVVVFPLERCHVFIAWAAKLT